jgi:hypothetical protein
MPELIQQQTPDYVGNILKGYQFGQQAKANQLQLLAAQQEMDLNQQKLVQAKAENTLTEMAAMGDQNALQRLAAYNPTRAEGVRKQQEFSDIQGARVLDSFASLPQYAFTQKKWEQMHNDYFEATGRELPLPYEKSPESILEFKRLSSRLKGREQDLKEQYQSAQIKTEGLQQGKIGVDIQKGKQDLQKGALDIMKLRGELLSAEEERQAARQQGLTLDAFREQQKKVGQFRGEQISKLPQVEQNVETTTKLVDELLKHKGFKAAVGTNITLVDRFIPGTDASGFMAKYNQLKGKQFLESISQLQGFGALSNLEGTTATNAASAMDISTSEEEFKRNAREYQRIMKIGLERMKRGVGYDNRPIEARGAETPQFTPSSNVINWEDL